METKILHAGKWTQLKNSYFIAWVRYFDIKNWNIKTIIAHQRYHLYKKKDK
jgi:hypothetical protein